MPVKTAATVDVATQDAISVANKVLIPDVLWRFRAMEEVASDFKSV